MPMTEHSAAILVGSWPSQSVMAWQGYAMAYSQAANSLFSQLDAQMDIKEHLAGMEGAFIDSARSLVQSRETALQNRIAAYRHISNKAHWAASELQATKTDLADIVNATEEKIKTSRENAEKAKQASAAIPGAVAVIESQLQAAIVDMVGDAKRDAMERDLKGATTVTALSNDIANWAAPYANSILPEAGGTPDLGGMPSAPAPAAPSSTGTTKPVDYKTDAVDPNRLSNAQQNTTKGDQVESQKNVQQTAMRNDTDPVKDAANEHAKSTSPASSAPSSPASSGGSSSGGNPASSIGQMMRPASSGSSSSGSSSPASSSSSAGNPAGAQSSQMANAKPGAVPATGAAASGAGAGGRAPGLASLGSGIAESSAKLASGAVNTGANIASNAAAAGGNVAQSVSQAAAQVPVSSAGSTMPAAAAPTGGGPMGMMPAAGGGVGGGGSVVNPVTSAPGSAAVGGGPAGTPAAAPVSGGGGVTPQAASAASLAPVAVQGPGVRGIGADGASGTALFEQAMDVGREVISSMVAQSSGYIEIHYAAALVYERGGTVSAWLATSEGASYIPLGVRVPQDVRLSVTDPVVGHELWSAAAAAGGANPLEVVVRQAEARELASPGGRVLAVASSLPMGQVIDWAGEVGARPVSVDPKAITKPAADVGLAHRCAVAMPWEWRQANAFSEHDRLKVAERHMYMAVAEGHLSSGAAEQVMELFESRQPIDDALWREVDRARFMSLIEYEMAMKSAGQGGADPARSLASARAAEVVLCLRHSATAEGCADLLYASRLAGAPLNPAAAVA